MLQGLLQWCLPACLSSAPLVDSQYPARTMAQSGCEHAEHSKVLDISSQTRHFVYCFVLAQLLYQRHACAIANLPYAASEHDSYGLTQKKESERRQAFRATFAPGAGSCGSQMFTAIWLDTVCSLCKLIWSSVVWCRCVLEIVRYATGRAQQHITVIAFAVTAKYHL